MFSVIPAAIIYTLVETFRSSTIPVNALVISGNPAWIVIWAYGAFVVAAVTFRHLPILNHIAIGLAVLTFGGRIVGFAQALSDDDRVLPRPNLRVGLVTSILVLVLVVFWHLVLAWHMGRVRVMRRCESDRDSLPT